MIHSDRRGALSELAFSRRAVIQPHVSPNSIWFVVIEGGGFVRVGDETARVFAGEAVLWPAGVLHGASTAVSEMRAIVVEFSEADDAALRGILSGSAGGLDAPAVVPAPGSATAETGGRPRGVGRLATDGRVDHDYDRSQGEPR